MTLGACRILLPPRRDADARLVLLRGDVLDPTTGGRPRSPTIRLVRCGVRRLTPVTGSTPLLLDKIGLARGSAEIPRGFRSEMRNDSRSPWPRRRWRASSGRVVLEVTRPSSASEILDHRA